MTMNFDSHYLDYDANADVFQNVECDSATLFEMKYNSMHQSKTQFYSEYKLRFHMECAYIKSYLDYQIKYKFYVLPQFEESEHPISYFNKLKSIYAERNALEAEHRALEIKMQSRLREPVAYEENVENQSDNHNRKFIHIFITFITSPILEKLSKIYNEALIDEKDLYINSIESLRSINQILDETTNLDAAGRERYMADIVNNPLLLTYVNSEHYQILSGIIGHLRDADGDGAGENENDGAGEE